ncbi:MAG: leucine-rich repeat domain-containing protein, partial [Bacteroidales bacterium]|nr:leucine-rich repeat domain-containing protein [Bacteroidales bacterium]
MIIRRTLIFLCAILCANVLFAQFYSGGVKYSINDSTVSVTGYDASTLPANLIIPTTVTNEETGISYTVTAIGESAFYYCQDLIAISIPNTVTSIGDYAFKNTPLVSITFEENSNLLTIGSYAFQYCSSLASIIIPKSVKSFGSYAFGSCSALSTVTFEEDSEL